MLSKVATYVAYKGETIFGYRERSCRSRSEFRFSKLAVHSGADRATLTARSGGKPSGRFRLRRLPKLPLSGEPLAVKSTAPKTTDFGIGLIKKGELLFPVQHVSKGCDRRLSSC